MKLKILFFSSQVLLAICLVWWLSNVFVGSVITGPISILETLLSNWNTPLIYMIVYIELGLVTITKSDTLAKKVIRIDAIIGIAISVIYFALVGTKITDQWIWEIIKMIIPVLIIFHPITTFVYGAFKHFSFEE